MIYHHLYDRSPKPYTSAALIGTGHFGTALLTQSLRIAKLRIPAVADKNLEAAKKTFRLAHVPEESVAVCDSEKRAKIALEQGKFVIVEDPMLLMGLPLDMIVEGTGVPEDGARHAMAAIENGKHVVMLNKETDTCVGPILNKLAKDRGLVYSPIDGDQHGLLIQMVEWARDNGMEVVCAAKSRDAEFIYDRSARTVANYFDEVNIKEDLVVPVAEGLLRYLDPMPEDAKAEYLEKRREITRGMPHAAGYDLCEMLVVANSVGLKPEIPALNDHIMRLSEFPRVLCEKSHGGVMNATGTIDVVSTLREPHEASMGGGVLMVVHCPNEYSQHILDLKGCLSNKSGDMSLVYRPYHLCGVESPTTLLCVGLLGISTGGREYRQVYDVVNTALVDLRAGDVMGGDKDPRFLPTMMPASPLAGNGPAPVHMMWNKKLRRDVPAGVTITYDMLEAPADSMLWKLRAMQDAEFVN